MTLLRTVLTFAGGGACGAAAVAVLFAPWQRPVAPDASPTAPAVVRSADTPRVPDGETRAVFVVTNHERQHIQSQMLAFLTALQTLNTAVAESDRELIAEVASAQATQHSPNAAGQTLRAKAPEGFTQISQSLRADFSALAEAAASEPMGEIQHRLGAITGKCVACHGTYAIAADAAD